VEIMGSQKCRIVGKYQSALIMINSIISTLTRTCGRVAGKLRPCLVLTSGGQAPNRRVHKMPNGAALDRQSLNTFLHDQCAHSRRALSVL
jgi:hypothetical protein